MAMNARAALAAVVAVGALAGCGPGSAATAAGPTSTANPGLTDGVTSGSGSAPDVARAIAARWADAGAPATALEVPIEFRSVEYSASIFSPGTPKAFTAFISTRRTFVVTPSSAASVEAANAAPARFATPADRALWRAEGTPDLGQAPTGGRRWTIPAGQYGFLPQGSVMTYREVAALPGDPRRLAAAVLDHLRPVAGATPPVGVQLRQLGYLIATAALTNPARSAAWQVLAALPGLRTCPSPLRWAHPHSTVVCISADYHQTQVGFDTTTGAILAIADLLLQPSPLYPHVVPGTVIESSTFTGAK